jgi:hypothetical protein
MAAEGKFWCAQAALGQIIAVAPIAPLSRRRDVSHLSALATNCHYTTRYSGASANNCQRWMILGLNPLISSRRVIGEHSHLLFAPSGEGYMVCWCRKMGDFASWTLSGVKLSGGYTKFPFRVLHYGAKPNKFSFMGEIKA